MDTNTNQEITTERRFPAVGMRNLKTATAAALCALVYYFLDRSPAFACIGAIFGMGPDMERSKLHGGNRLFGTIIGGVLGMALYRVYLVFHPEGGGRCCWCRWYFSARCCSLFFAKFFGWAVCSPAAWCCASCCSTPRRTAT